MRWSSRLAAALVVSAMIGACVERTVPTSKTPSPAPTDVTGASAIVLVAMLHSGPGQSGLPAAAGESACRGAATVTIDPTPRGALNLAVARFQVTIIGCPPGTTLTSVHLHRMPIGTVEEWIGSDLPEFAMPSGDGSFTSTNQGVPLARAQAVVDDPTNFYIHFHSRNNPVGFLRGELMPR